MKEILYYQLLIVCLTSVLVAGKNMGNPVSVEEAAGDMSEKYRLFTDKTGYSIIMEKRDYSGEFYFKEYINGPIEDYYLCTKDGARAEREEEAYLYVDLGKQGEWWADPFGNLQTELTVENEYIPDTLLEEMEKNAEGLLFCDAVRLWVEDAGARKLTDEEMKQKAPEVFEEVYNEDAVFQYYYEVDFDNDGLDDIMAENRLGMGKMGHEETYFYRQEKDGQYRRTFESSSGSCYNRIMRYEGKNYYILICCDMDGYVQQNYGFDYYFCELYDFQNGRPEEMVRLTPRVLEEAHGKECGNMETAEERKLNVSVKRRFVNDFINQSLGAH